MTRKISILLALALIPALALTACTRKRDPDVNVIVYDADDMEAAAKR